MNVFYLRAPRVLRFNVPTWVRVRSLKELSNELEEYFQKAQRRRNGGDGEETILRLGEKLKSFMTQPYYSVTSLRIVVIME